MASSLQKKAEKTCLTKAGQGGCREWPDDKLKSCPNFSKSCPKSSHSSLTVKILLFTLAHKLTKCIWASFDSNHVTKNFQKQSTLGYFDWKLTSSAPSSRRRSCLSRGWIRWSATKSSPWERTNVIDFSSTRISRFRSRVPDSGFVPDLDGLGDRSNDRVMDRMQRLQIWMIVP